MLQPKGVETPKENGRPGFMQTQAECPVEALTKLANCHAFWLCLSLA